MAWHKIVWNDFEQALLDPQGEGHDCTDAGGRATQDAVAEDARSNLQKSAIHHEIAAVTLFLRNDRNKITVSKKTLIFIAAFTDSEKSEYKAKFNEKSGAYDQAALALPSVIAPALLYLLRPCSRVLYGIRTSVF